MGPGSATRLTVDVCFAAACIACFAVAFADDTPPLASDVCESADGRPRYGELPSTIRVSAVFGKITDAADRQSIETFERALVARGFVATGDRTYRVDSKPPIVIEIIGPLDRAFVDPTLDVAIATSDILYYNGHEYDGTLTFTAPSDRYRIVVLDSCWTTQRYARPLLTPTVDLVTNTERAITGSVESFVAFLDGIRSRATWRDLLEPMNELAERRAIKRTSLFSKYRKAEHYRRDVVCDSEFAEDK